MDTVKTWNPLTDWKPQKIDWIKVDISPADLKRFTTRSDFKGLCHAVGFLMIIATSGSLAYYAFSQQQWALLALALYIHGSLYSMFSSALHELSHNTVFASRFLSTTVTALFGWLYWAYNPYFYRLSHHTYHHRYTLYQGSDAEDTPTYVELTPWLTFQLFFKVISIRSFILAFARFITLKPTSNGWRGRGIALDQWEQFILREASKKDLERIRRHCIGYLIGHIVFVALSVYVGCWFLPVLITFAPFYGPRFMPFVANSPQHAGCNANEPDFRKSCATTKLDPLTSFLHWRMEYHVEHHMFAGIPCYNLKAFRTFVEDQLPPREYALPHLIKASKICKEKFGSPAEWSANFGKYKGL
jgi:fatty acid desaturase